MKQGLKVFAPASVANVAVGYDILGFAIQDIGDDVLVRSGSEPGLSLHRIVKNKGLSTNVLKNTASFSAYKLLEHLGKLDEPIEMELIKNMAIGTGLGSSASSAVAGVFAVNEFMGQPLSKKELLPFATEGEQLADGSFHADNVAPSLLGGVILIRDHHPLDIIRLPSPTGFKILIVHPNIEILTKTSRSVLSEQVSLDKHIKQSGNLAGFVAALYRSDWDLLGRSINDVIIEPQRSSLIPYFDQIKKIALDSGVLGFSISGAGPSMFGLCYNSITAERAQENIMSFYRQKKLEANIFITEIDNEGARKY